MQDNGFLQPKVSKEQQMCIDQDRCQHAQVHYSLSHKDSGNIVTFKQEMGEDVCLNRKVYLFGAVDSFTKNAFLFFNHVEWLLYLRPPHINRVLHKETNKIIR